MPVQVFVDDSGGKGQGPFLVFAGLVADAEDWAGFSDEWRQSLQESPPIAYFKMNEAAGLGGQFWGWPAANRDAKIRKLAQVVNRFVPVVIHCTVDLEGFAETLSAHSGKPLSEPYFWPFQVMTMSVCYDLLERGLREECEIIFDEHVIFGPRVKVWYPIIRDLMEPEVRAIAPVEPLFRSDAKFPPIQAADMFAWCFRRGTSQHPNAFDWILPEISSIELSRHSNFYSKERMQAIVEDSYKREVAQEMVKKYRDLLGLE